MNNSICFVIRTMSGGGIETVTLNLAEKLTQKGVDVTLILLTKHRVNYKISSDINIVIINDFLDSYLGKLSRLINLFIPLLGSAIFSSHFASRFDSVVGRLEREKGAYDKVYFCGFGAYTVLYKTGLKNVIFQCHNTNSVLLRKKSKLFYNFSTRLFRTVLDEKIISCVSEGIMHDLIDNLGVKPAKCGVVYNLICDKKIKLLSSESISISKPYILHVGRFVTEKRQAMLIEAYRNIDSKNKPRLVFLGDGPELKNCREYVVKHDLSSNVDFLGFVSNPYPYIKNAEFLVLCSEHEGLPTVLLEAQFLNTYCVSSNCPSGPSEIIDNKSLGRLFDVGSVGQLTNIMNELLTDYDMSKIKRDITPGSKFDSKFIVDKYLGNTL